MLGGPGSAVHRSARAARCTASGTRAAQAATMTPHLHRLAAWHDAITRAGSVEGEKVRDALAGTKDFPGASGTITIDAERNAQKPIVILKIIPGKSPAERTKFVTSIKP